MSSSPQLTTLLIADENPADRDFIQRLLQAPERRILTAGSAHEALLLAAENELNMTVLDLRLGGGDGLSLLRALLRLQPDMECVCTTPEGSIPEAVDAMRQGASDYLTKPLSPENLLALADQARQKPSRPAGKRAVSSSSCAEDDLVGDSERMREVRYLLEKAAPTEVPVLLTGPSGAGKDVLAHAIQRHSLRADKPFIIKNCASLQKDLARSELFGHVRGAFTGAVSDSIGLFGEADRGTLFLDEIGDLPLDIQPSLLRVLENGTYRPVGAQEQRHCDIRFLFATNRDLAAAVRAGTFNEALYHRIHVFTIALPPLKDRLEDLPALVDHFLRILPVASNHPPTLDPCVMGCLMRYAWPGNVRELRNVIERAVILAENGRITSRCLPPEMGCQCSSADTLLPGQIRNASPAESLEDIERAHILRVLEQCGHNRTQAARRLGISRRTLYRKLQGPASA